jgi:hypothetical protein
MDLRRWLAEAVTANEAWSAAYGPAVPTHIEASDYLQLYQVPELDIVSYFPAATSLSAIDAASNRILHAGMHDVEDPVFLRTLKVSAEAMRLRHPDITADADGARILRSVLMKPESGGYVEHLHKRVEALAQG